MSERRFKALCALAAVGIYMGAYAGSGGPVRLPWTAGRHRAERGRNVFQTAGTKYFIIRTEAGGDSASGFFCLVRQMCAKRNPQLFIDGWKVPETTFFIAFFPVSSAIYPLPGFTCCYPLSDSV